MNEQIKPSLWTLHFLSAAPISPCPSQCHFVKELLSTYLCFSFIKKKKKKSCISSFNLPCPFRYLLNSLILLANFLFLFFLANFLGRVVCTLSLTPYSQSLLSPPAPGTLLWPKSMMTAMWLTWSFQCFSYSFPRKGQCTWPFLLFKTLSSLGLNDTKPLPFLFSLLSVFLLVHVDSSSFCFSSRPSP